MSRTFFFFFFLRMPLGGAGAPGGGSAARLSGFDGEGAGAGAAGDGAGAGTAGAGTAVCGSGSAIMCVRRRRKRLREALARERLSLVRGFPAATQRKRTLSAKSSKKLQLNASRGEVWPVRSGVAVLRRGHDYVLEVEVKTLANAECPPPTDW